MLRQYVGYARKAVPVVTGIYTRNIRELFIVYTSSISELQGSNPWYRSYRYLWRCDVTGVRLVHPGGQKVHQIDLGG